MKRALFIHIYTATVESIDILRQNGINPIACSLPHFVPGDSPVRKCLAESGVSVFNVDSLNFQSPRDLSAGTRSLDSRYLWQLMLMSQRFPGYRRLEMQEIVSKCRDIYSACVDDILLRLGIDVLCFGGVPHSMADYLLLLAAKSLHIQIRISQDYPLFPGGSVFYDENLVPLENQVAYASSYAEGYYNFCKHSIRLVQQNFVKSGIFIPYRTNHGLGKWDAVYSAETKCDIKSPAGEEYKRFWNSKASRNLNRRFVPVFLHAEPEAMTNPAFPMALYPQIESIAALRKSLDSDVSILVKEHPSMFDAYPDEDVRYLESNRPPSFFRQLDATDHVSLLNSEITVRECIDNSEFVFCACGSVSIQAILSRKAVVGVAFNPINRHPGFIDIQGISCSRLIEAQTLLSAMSDDQLVESLAILSCPGSANGTFNMFVQPDELANSMLYAMSLTQHLQ